MRGSARGAKPENQEWVLITRPARASRSALSRLIVWVEPVLPQTSNPSTRAPCPVPPSLADLHMPAMISSKADS